MVYFEPTSSERRGLIVLCVALLLALVVGGYVYMHRNSDTEVPTTEQGRGVRQQRYYAQSARQAETFDFDPNEADSTALLRLGFAPFQVRGIYKYRAMGGRYHEPGDVKRIPGMTNELWERLQSHIRINHKYQYVEVERPNYGQRPQVDVREELSLHRDTTRYPVKLTEGLVVPLNEADTTALKKVPGIGSYYARRIVDYRNKLGGFVSLAQLQEIEGMPEDVERWFSLSADSVHRIRVNQATKNQLVRHPYLRVYRARAIWDYRHNVGPLHSLDDLRRLPDFTEDDIRRLAPYLSFD